MTLDDSDEFWLQAKGKRYKCNFPGTSCLWQYKSLKLKEIYKRRKEIYIWKERNTKLANLPRVHVLVHVSKGSRSGARFAENPPLSSSITHQSVVATKQPDNLRNVISFYAKHFWSIETSRSWISATSYTSISHHTLQSMMIHPAYNLYYKKPFNLQTGESVRWGDKTLSSVSWSLRKICFLRKTARKTNTLRKWLLQIASGD